ncbi:peptidoglycan editing factor PgeF [Tumidithrix helvetica PCC 7403]|uniref:peptidoglycan editing factor PgeF n=1 Tax=Tumidithrix helvetica TaxID=3457545 RepID=UPI003C856309
MDGSSWHWRDGILTCDLLSQWQHGFFTRSHNPQMPQDLHRSFYSEGVAYRAKQVHGDRLIHAQDISTEPPLPEADGVWVSPEFANAPTSVWVCSADCVPILIGDRRLGAVAAVHAGWRGTAAKIVKETAIQMCQRGSELKDLLVALGPAIAGEAYQVSQSVAEQVVATIQTRVGVTPDREPDRCRLDLRLVQQQQLKELGIDAEQVAIAPYCTLQTPEHFFSYRRYCLEHGLEAKRSPQVQWSGIAIG